MPKLLCDVIIPRWRRGHRAQYSTCPYCEMTSYVCPNHGQILSELFRYSKFLQFKYPSKGHNHLHPVRCCCADGNLWQSSQHILIVIFLSLDRYRIWHQLEGWEKCGWSHAVLQSLACGSREEDRCGKASWRCSGAGAIAGVHIAGRKRYKMQILVYDEAMMPEINYIFIYP